MEDGGVKYVQEVELPNGHKWRQRADGGWCRFSKKTCFPKGKTRKKTRTHDRNSAAGDLKPEFTKSKVKDIRKEVIRRPKVKSTEIAEVKHHGNASHKVPLETMAKTINDPQVILLAKNGNLVFYKNGTIVITKGGDITQIQTSFGRGGTIPARHTGPGKLYPAGSAGQPETPIKLTKFIESNSGTDFAVHKIWP